MSKDWTDEFAEQAKRDMDRIMSQIDQIGRDEQSQSPSPPPPQEPPPSAPVPPQRSVFFKVMAILIVSCVVALLGWYMVTHGTMTMGPTDSNVDGYRGPDGTTTAPPPPY